MNHTGYQLKIESSLKYFSLLLRFLIFERLLIYRLSFLLGSHLNIILRILEMRYHLT